MTIPHKEAAASLARVKPKRMCKSPGSANTLVRRDDGNFIASNTDYPAAIGFAESAPRGARVKKDRRCNSIRFLC